MDITTVVPKRFFGNSGVKISKLCLGGGSFIGGNSQVLLDEALRLGVDCWEIVYFTGDVYANYFKQYPGIREKVFLSGKVSSTNPVIMQEQLDKILVENGTSVIDFLAIHGVDNIAMLTDEVRKWAEKAKREKKIRFFGFCTHKNMAACLSGAADLGWVDGVQTVYNYRLQKQNDIEDALQKCHDNGVGIFAVKSMGLCVQQEAELLSHTMDKRAAVLATHDMSFEQAKLKAIWQNPHLSSICSLMSTTAILQSNVEAAKDERSFPVEVKEMLENHASSTGRYFCSRCGLCDTVNMDKIPIFNIMEILMYLRGYGMKDLVAKLFAQIPGEVRNRIGTSDYSRAEEICPQKMPIAQLMKEAVGELST